MNRERADRLLNAEDPEDPAERGVSYEFLVKLLNKQKLHSLTTRQVVRQYVVPQTFGAKCSLSGLLKQIQPHSVGRATHYLVHPWDGSFERLVSALGVVDGSHDDEEGNPPYFWIDIFALNQRQLLEGYRRIDDAWLHRDELFSQFRYCVRNIGKICAIMDPVSDPIIVKRAWCMFECAHAISEGKELMLCAVPEAPDVDPFLDVTYNFRSTVEKYQVKFASTNVTIPIDKEWLDSEVLSLSPLGIKWLDERVNKEVLGWLCDRVAGRVLSINFVPLPDESRDFDIGLLTERLLMMQYLCRLLGELERETKAREILEHAVIRAQQTFSPEAELSLSLEHDLACLCAKSFGELRKADQQLRRILTCRRQLHGEEHALVIETEEALGRVLKERRKLSDAIALFRHVAAVHETTNGPDDFSTLVALNLLALTLQKREQYAEAEKIFRRVVSSGIDTLGPSNLDVMVWSNNLAVLYQDTKQLDKAEVLLRTTLRNAEQALGPTHAHSLTLAFNLGYCLWHQGRIRLAEGIFRRELAGCEVTKGPNHPDTLRSRQNLARLLATQPGREKEAEALLREEGRRMDALSASTQGTVAIDSNPQRRVVFPDNIEKLNDDARDTSPQTDEGHNSTPSWEPESQVQDNDDDRTADDGTASGLLSDEDLIDDDDAESDDVLNSEYEDDDDITDGASDQESIDSIDDDDDDDDITACHSEQEDSYSSDDDNTRNNSEEENEQDNSIYSDPEFDSHLDETFSKTDDTGSKEDYDEEVEEYNDDTLNDIVVQRFCNGQRMSTGRARREQTVTSDDEFIVYT